MPLTTCVMMAETELSKDYDRKKRELSKRGWLSSYAKLIAAQYARARERERNADKSGR